jgi:hypothetical protein
MGERDGELSSEAQEWHDLIQEVHEHESSTQQSPPASHPKDPIGHWARLTALFMSKQGLVIIAAFALLMFLLALAFLPGFTGDDGSPDAATPAPAPAVADEETPAADPQPDEAEAGGVVADSAAADTPVESPGPTEEPTHEDLAAQDPIPLTDGSWRFFGDATEAQALYDFVFLADGTFHESGAEHNHGTYTEDGTTVTMELTRVHTVSASDGVNERSEEIDWQEVFTMTRIGNTLDGDWTKEDWIFGYDDGLVRRGMLEPFTGIFARPERPSDPG